MKPGQWKFKHAPDTLVVSPMGGLCNRLRNILCFYHNYKDTYKLKFLWMVNHDETGIVDIGKFTDYFESLPGTEFIYNSDHIKELNVTNCIDWKAYHAPTWLPPGVSPTPDTVSHLKLTKEVQSVVDNHTDSLPTQYLAIHSRGTDMYLHQQRLNNNADEWQKNRDQSHHEFLDSHPDIEDVYIATDSVVAQQHYMSTYPARTIHKYKMIGPDRWTVTDGHQGCPQRNTDIIHTIVDMYTCSRATHFTGTKFSSLSGFISALRGK